HASSAFLVIHPPTSPIYPLSLHDALPISPLALYPSAGDPRFPCQHAGAAGCVVPVAECCPRVCGQAGAWSSLTLSTTGFLRLSPDRKSTRLNSSHSQLSYAVFGLKKKDTS